MVGRQRRRVEDFRSQASVVGSLGVAGLQALRRSGADGSFDRWQLGSEILARIHELVAFHLVLLVVELPIPTVLGEQLGVPALFDDLPAFEHENLV